MAVCFVVINRKSNSNWLKQWKTFIQLEEYKVWQLGWHQVGFAPATEGTRAPFLSFFIPQYGLYPCISHGSPWLFQALVSCQPIAMKCQTSNSLMEDIVSSLAPVAGPIDSDPNKGPPAYTNRMRLNLVQKQRKASLWDQRERRGGRSCSTGHAFPDKPWVGLLCRVLAPGGGVGGMVELSAGRSLSAHHLLPLPSWTEVHVHFCTCLAVRQAPQFCTGKSNPMQGLCTQAPAGK